MDPTYPKNALRNPIQENENAIHHTKYHGNKIKNPKYLLCTRKFIQAIKTTKIDKKPTQNTVETFVLIL